MSSRYTRSSRVWVRNRSNGCARSPSHNAPTEQAATLRSENRRAISSTNTIEATSNLAIVTVVSAFCEHLKARCPHKSYKNDVSRLRVFFGQICDELKLGRPGSGTGGGAKPHSDKFAHAHVKAERLEDVSPAVMNRFITDRIREDAWSAKTANDFREVLHRLFAFAIKHHGFCSRDRRNANPVASVERQRESAPQIRFLTLEQIEEQIKILEGHPVIQALVATYI